MDDREKLVALLFKCTPKNVKTELCGEKITTTISEGNIADFLIAHGVTAQEWISVDERLPENDVMVIGYTPCDGFMFVGYYHEEPKFVGYYHKEPKYDWKLWRIVTAMRSTKIMKKKVTHWMPLPKPPKGE